MTKPIFIRNTIFLVFLAVILITGLRGFKEEAKAAGPTSISGWLWSSNIGWVSLNSTNPTAGAGGTYSVAVSPGGDLSGYGWSSNIGWLSFNATDVGGCPGGVGARITGTQLTGWARFVAGTGSPSTCPATDPTNAGCWDGCVELTSVSVNPATGAITGYGWGSTVVGWLQFLASTQPITQVTLFLTASPSPVPAPYETNLTWQASDPSLIANTPCVATGGWTGAKTAPSTTNGIQSQSSVAVASPSSLFTLECDTTLNTKVSAEVRVFRQIAGVGFCGDGVIDLDEDCEGGVGNETCETRGFAGGGILVCTNCKFDTTNCVGKPGAPVFEEF